MPDASESTCARIRSTGTASLASTNTAYQNWSPGPFILYPVAWLSKSMFDGNRGFLSKERLDGKSLAVLCRVVGQVLSLAAIFAEV